MEESTDAESADVDDAQLLEELGYVDGTTDEAIATHGVVVHDREHAWQGLNFYASRNQSAAQLVDMNGEVVHRWEVPKTGGWQHVTLLPNGDVLVLVKDQRLFRIDKDSKVLWSYTARVHHDLDVLDDGTIIVLARREVERPRLDAERKTVDDLLLTLNSRGRLRSTMSILETLEASPYSFLINDSDSLVSLSYPRANPPDKKAFDVLHSNHVEVIGPGHPHPAFAEGNLLLSPRNANTVLVIDPKTGEIPWLWGSSGLIFQHHPTLTPDGTVLIFNNGTKQTGSQVLEVDPMTNDIVWTYGPEDHFFSNARGSLQRLPNGNTLITESDTGYVFEVTREGETVWEFRNPHRYGKRRLRMAIWRMLRFQPEDLPFLDELSQKQPASPSDGK